MKRKTLTLTLCLLALVALFSVGFAAWVVTAPINDTDASGNFVVEEVSDERVTLTATIAEGQDSIIFGKEAVAVYDAVEQKWATEDGKYPYAYKWVLLDDLPEEKLEVVVTVKITGYEWLESITLNLTTELDAEATKPDTYGGVSYTGKDYDDAVSENLVGALDTNLINRKLTKSDLEALTDTDADIYCIDNGDNTATVTIKVKFTWGTAFNGLNPGKYFNSINIEDSENVDKKATGDFAVQSLKNLEGYLTGVSYKLTVQGKDNKAE